MEDDDASVGSVAPASDGLLLILLCHGCSSSGEVAFEADAGTFAKGGCGGKRGWAKADADAPGGEWRQ